LAEIKGKQSLTQYKEKTKTKTWWYMPVISTLRRLRQEDHKFKANLSYMARSWK
jgi:hypothetical protein